MKKLLTAYIALAAATMVASAAVIVEESFNYTLTDSLSGKSGGSGDAGFGWSGNWTQVTAGNDLLVSAAPSSPSSQAFSSGNAISKTGTGPDTGTIYTRDITGIGSGATFTPSDLWFSFQMGGSANVGTRFRLSVLYSANTNAGFSIGNYQNNATTSERDRYTVRTGTSSTNLLTTTTAISSSTSTPDFIVGRLAKDGGAGGTERLDLWLNPTEASSEGALGAVWQTVDLLSFAKLDRVQLEIGNSATGVFDEIRFGTTLDAVAVPEPTSYALLGLAGFTLFVLRRFNGGEF